MNKSTLKKALLLGAVGGLVVLGFHAQKYVRLFMALRNGVDSSTTPEEEVSRESQLDEMLKNGAAIKVRISSSPENDDEVEDS